MDVANLKQTKKGSVKYLNLFNLYKAIISSIASSMPIGVTSLFFSIVKILSICSEVFDISSIALLSTLTFPFLNSVITISIPYLALTFSSVFIVL